MDERPGASSTVAVDDHHYVTDVVGATADGTYPLFCSDVVGATADGTYRLFRSADA